MALNREKTLPFLVKEEKILLIAMQSKESSVIIEAVKQIISNCVVDDIDVLEFEAMLTHDSADTIGPATGGLEVGFDDHVVSVCVDGRGAR